MQEITRTIVRFRATRLITGIFIMTGLVLTDPPRSHTAGKTYVAEFGSSSVGVIDGPTRKVVGHIAVPRGAHGLAIIPDGSRVFVSSDESAIITVIDASKDEVIGTIPTGKQPHGLAVGSGGRFVYAAVFGDNQVLEINPRTLKVERTFDVANPHNLAPSPDGTDLFVASQKPGETCIADIDVRSGTIRSTIPTLTAPRSLNVSPDGTILCATFFDSNQVNFYSTHPFKGTGAVPVGNSPHHVTFTPDGSLVLVVNQVSNDLTLIDSGTRKVTGNIKVGRKPHWISPTMDSKYAYVTDEGSNEVSFVDLEEKEVEQTLTVGLAPRKIAVQPHPDASAKMWTAGGHSASAMGEGDTVVVKIQGPPPRFAPSTLTVRAGTTVEWVNTAKGLHTVTDDTGQWDSGSLSPGEKFSRRFTEPGTYPYYCIPHRAMGMVGTIIVKE